MNYIRKQSGKYASKKWATRKRKMFATAIIGIAGLYAFVIIQYSRLYDELSLPAPIESVEAQSEMSIYDQICQASGGENCDVLYNLAKCESSLNPEAYHINTNGTFDLGIMQWNSVHFTNKITPSCALNLECSVKLANEEVKKGHLNWWVCGDKI